jgi:hypothetical protein
VISSCVIGLLDPSRPSDNCRAHIHACCRSDPANAPAMDATSCRAKTLQRTLPIRDKRGFPLPDVFCSCAPAIHSDYPTADAALFDHHDRGIGRERGAAGHGKAIWQGSQSLLGRLTRATDGPAFRYTVTSCAP